MQSYLMKTCQVVMKERLSEKDKDDMQGYEGTFDMLLACDSWYGKVKQKGSSWQGFRAGARAGAGAITCRLCSGR